MSTAQTMSDEDFQARLDLGDFVRSTARETAREVGFTWCGTPSAPSTYQQLRGAFVLSEATGRPLPVSNLFCNATIYLSDATNMAFRFWHDVSHVKLGLSFRLEDELELAIWHLDQAALAGFTPGSRAYELFSADLTGQILLMALVGRFPFDQRRFVDTCTTIGLMPGLLDEIRQVP